LVFVRSEAQRIASQRGQHTLNINGRMVMLAVTATAMAAKLGSSTAMEEVLTKLAEFQTGAHR